MITVIAGGKRPTGWQQAAIVDFQKRLRKPFDLGWQFLTEEKLAKLLANWPFDSAKDYVIVCDERGTNISSDEYSQRLESVMTSGKRPVILIGGAYGFDEGVRQRADFVWSFSKLVLPHALARVLVTEQTYRAQEIAKGRPYHHG